MKSGFVDQAQKEVRDSLSDYRDARRVAAAHTKARIRFILGFDVWRLRIMKFLAELGIPEDRLGELEAMDENVFAFALFEVIEQNEEDFFTWVKSEIDHKD